MKIFLGYPSEHPDKAKEVVEFIKSVDLDVWYDDRIVGGEFWRPAREEAQNKAEFIIHLIAAEMMKRKGDVHREFKLTLDLAKDQPPKSNFFVVIKLDETPVPVEATDREWIEWKREDWRLR